MSGPAVAALCANPRAPAILTGLARRQFFTVRHRERGGVYRYHPLFRQYLLQAAREALGPGRFSDLQARAARILEEAGELERAADSYVGLNDWTGLGRVLQSLAPSMLEQGRFRILLAWLEPLGEGVLSANARLRYWRAAAMMPVDPRRAAAEFARAWTQSLDGGDMTGAYLAWTSSVEGLLLMHDLELVGRWVSDRHRLDPGALASLPPALQVRFVAALFHAMYIATPDDPEIGEWERRTIDMLEPDLPADARLLVGVTLLLRATYYGPGNTRSARIVARVGPAAASPEASPWIAYAWHSLLPQHHYWYDEDFRCAGMRASLEAWEALARKHDFHPMRHIGYVHALLLALADGDLEGGAIAVAALDTVGHVSKQERSFHEWLRAWHCQVRGDFVGMSRHAESAVRIAEETGLTTTVAPTLVLLGKARSLNGDLRGALPPMRRSRRMARRVGMAWVECLSLLLSATIALRNRRPRRAAGFLRAGFAIAARERFMRLPGLTREELARLSAAALEHGIETAYVRTLIRCRQLQPPHGAGPRDWPCSPSAAWAHSRSCATTCRCALAARRRASRSIC
jgi:hypothetical protein